MPAEARSPSLECSTGLRLARIESKYGLCETLVLCAQLKWVLKTFKQIPSLSDLLFI